MRILFLPLVFVLSVGWATGQPSVASVANAASNAFPGLPNAPIAQGAMFVVYGTGMGPDALVQAGGFPLSVGLGGTSARVVVSGSPVDAVMIYTSGKQIAAVLPSTTPVGTGTIAVTYNGQTGASAPITVVAGNFGIFTVNQAGSGSGIVTYPDYALVSFDKAANPAETLLIWGTGLGPVKGDEATGPLPGNLAGVPVEVFVGGKPAAVTYRGRSGCCAGLDQIAFIVPDGITGCSVPLAVKIKDLVSNFASVAVATNGRVCPNTFGPLVANPFSRLPVIGAVELVRYGDSTPTADYGSASFSQTAHMPFLANAVPVGACTVTTSVGQVGIGIPCFGTPSEALGAGSAITIAGPIGNRTLAKACQLSTESTYYAELGNATPGNYLDTGTYTITGPGGAGIGGFSVSITVPPALAWTNVPSTDALVRADGQLITWTGGDPQGIVEIAGTGYVRLAEGRFVSADFTCRSKVSDGSFTVPSFVLSALPPGSGSLAISSSTTPQQFTATGLDLGLARSSVQIYRSVTYR